MKKRSRKCLSALLALALLTTTVPIAPVMAAQSSGKNDTATITTSDAAVESVQEMIDSLPTTDELAAMTKDEQSAVYTNLQAAYDAYNALTDGQKEEVTGAEMFDSLFEVFNSMVNALATVNGVSYLDEDGSKKTQNNVTVVESSTTTWNSGGWYVVNKDVTISDRVTVSGTVHLILADGYTLDAESGIDVPENSHLLIYAQSTGDSMGVLNATGSGTANDAKAGIGGGPCGSITINGGKITAKANPEASEPFGATGIGGNHGNGVEGTITINGGEVTAIGGGLGFGIGASWYDGTGGTIIINGGSVYAQSGTAIPEYGTCGMGGAGDSKIILNGGVVIAKKTTNGGYGVQGEFSAAGDGVIFTDGFSSPGDTNSWKGVIFQGTSGKVYAPDGNKTITITDSFEIPSGYTLEIPDGVTLVIPEGVTLTNNGTISGDGTLTGAGVLAGSGSVTVAENGFRPDAAVSVTIEGEQVQDNTAPYGSTITLTAAISEAEANALTRAAANQVEFFVGADSSKISLGTATVSNNVATKQITLTGENWKPGTYTITAEYGGSSSLKPASGTATLTVVAIQLATPTNLLWEDGTKATWDAVDNASSYTVQLFKDNGETAIETKEVSTETSCTFDSFSKPAAGSYTFTVTAKGTGNYSDSQPSSQSAALAFYTVFFNTNDGSAIDRQVIVDGGKVNKPADPTKTGHTFKGWYSDQGLTTPWNFDNNTISKTTTLYAKWEANTYTVTLHTNGGTIAEGKDVTSYTYGIGATLPNAADMTYTGHTFKGWYEDGSFSGKPVTEISKTDIGNKTFYAKWVSTNAGVKAVSVNGTAGTINGTTITVVLPYGTTSLPVDSSKVSIIPVTGAKVSELNTADNGKTWTFTVTAEDGETTEHYTINVSIAADPSEGNREDVNAAKSTIENNDWTVPQADANTEAAVKAWIEGQLAAMNLNGASYDVVITDIEPAVAGTAADRDGTNGSFAFTVKLSKGEDTENVATSTYAEATAEPSGTITAAPYTKWTVTVDAEGAGTVNGGGTFENGTTVTVTATPNSSRHYFIRWMENGVEVSRDATYSFVLTADRTLTAEFGTYSSGGGGTVTPSYTLTFDTNGGSALEPVKAKRGTTIDLTDYMPNRDGYTFNGWYADEDLSKQLTSITLNSNKTIYAGWTKNTVEPLPFTDVDENDWFYNPVRWAFLEGLMTGTSDTEFSPNLATTRGMIVSVLYRLEGSPDLSDENLGYPYQDVDANAWYAMPVYWARLHGIVSGYNNSQFGPNDAITREQLAAILMNYAAYKGMDVSARADLGAYSDADTISTWANATMQWAVAEGYISGMTADTLAPQGSATRAQVAAIFQRFLEGE